MKLEQSFEVKAPIDVVWTALNDLERVAPCLPGAAITGHDDDGTYHGEFKVKLGPTTAAYKGTIKIESADESTHTATLAAKGSDKRGQGGANATIVNTLHEIDGGTRVDAVTDFSITGRLARFGRGGMIQDISNRLLRDFATCLATRLGEDAPSAPSGAEVTAGQAAPEAVGAAAPEARTAPDAGAAVSSAAGAAAGDAAGSPAGASAGSATTAAGAGSATTTPVGDAGSPAGAGAGSATTTPVGDAGSPAGAGTGAATTTAGDAAGAAAAATTAGDTAGSPPGASAGSATTAPVGDAGSPPVPAGEHRTGDGTSAPAAETPPPPGTPAVAGEAAGAGPNDAPSGPVQGGPPPATAAAGGPSRSVAPPPPNEPLKAGSLFWSVMWERIKRLFGGGQK